MKCGDIYCTFLKEMEFLFYFIFILNSFVTCLVKPFHFHTRSGWELKGGPFALFIPSNIPHPTYHVNWSPIPIHVYEYMGHNINMVGQSKTLIFSAPWRDYHYGWPIKNTHFLSPVESSASWACLQAKLKGPLSMGSSVQMPRNQFGLIWSKLNPWVGLWGEP
jgi:hypothetical protein